MCQSKNPATSALLSLYTAAADRMQAILLQRKSEVRKNGTIIWEIQKIPEKALLTSPAVLLLAAAAAAHPAV